MEEVKYIQLHSTVNNLGIIFRKCDIMLVKDCRVNREVHATINGVLQTFLVVDEIDDIFKQLTNN